MLVALLISSTVVLWSILLYWLVDYALKGRLPWDDTYFSRTLVIPRGDDDEA